MFCLLTTSNSPLSEHDNRKTAKYAPPAKSNSMSMKWTSFRLFSNFLTQAPLLTGLLVELYAFKVILKYILAGLA